MSKPTFTPSRIDAGVVNDGKPHARDATSGTLEARIAISFIPEMDRAAVRRETCALLSVKPSTERKEHEQQ